MPENDSLNIHLNDDGTFHINVHGHTVPWSQEQVQALHDMLIDTLTEQPQGVIMEAGLKVIIVVHMTREAAQEQVNHLGQELQAWQSR